jgi:hypothetical protein
MHAPSKPATDDEIVEAIADALKPWKPQRRQIETGRRAGEIEDKSQAEMLAAISDAAREDILRLRATVPTFFDRRAIQKTRDDARDTIELIDQLEAQLSAKTLSPELRLRLRLPNESIRMIGNPVKDESPVPRLLDALKTVREICEAGDKNQPNGNQVKRWCARVAMTLVLKFSEENPSAGSAGSKYCEITDLIYWAVTKKKQSLRRICQDILKLYRPYLPA